MHPFLENYFTMIVPVLCLGWVAYWLVALFFPLNVIVACLFPFGVFLGFIRVQNERAKAEQSRPLVDTFEGAGNIDSSMQKIIDELKKTKPLP
jgi:hypothetical protein